MEKLTDKEPITVEGIPLEAHLEEEATDEIKDAYNGEMRERSRAKGRVSRKDALPVKEGVSKRVRRLKAQEIRKEYGLMQKRHTKQEGGIGADCLWLIRYKSPMTANEAADILGGSRSSISGIFSQLWKALGGKYIKRERGVGLPYEYSPLEEFDHLFAYGLVRKYYAVKSRAARVKAREKKAGTAPPKQEQGELELKAKEEDRIKLWKRIGDLQIHVNKLNKGQTQLQESVRNVARVTKDFSDNLETIKEAASRYQPATPVNVGAEIKELNFAIGGMMEIKVIFTSS